ncbi:MAG: outer membrane beta-barrel protein [Spirochaetaceae bacterium]|jgi:opacity protein-like surface antigen|nr:outer membrane beta-barrel protein [Spirochaetaceae bacterium]
MAKKSLAVLVAAIMAVGGVFAQDNAQENAKPKPAFDISAGVGGLFIGDFGGGVEASASMSGQSISDKMEMPNSGGGGYVFVDATYAELTVAIAGGSGTFKSTRTQPGQSDRSDESDMSMANLNIGLLGKYPIAMNDKLTLFPLLGIDYAICLSVKDEDGEEFKGMDGEGGPGDFSALWFKFGGGLDFALSEKLYLRFEALYGLRLANTFEKDMKDQHDKGYEQAKNAGADVDVKTLLGHGLTAKLAVGYRF